ncbi:Nucleoporin protein Ndc1-Nup [Plasmopara halstedii]|uniref:Nucleoporin protein Ndc1-Nup n=1 Tax=Plasmopara halstedii TaxID=4781 RepID=A0A0N7L7I3_PLAHL|nr:Nucleoporin protein Ndc1-Nup [Plasmopara halstedii]CEG47155.1 Nucleoporin protein Ndc1-Nup [Plasmopara halstedii]|eukprot:XP_024583524.1 Nucleoporin protein Ndc1-Nup [Plasmopara halstedii]
MGFSHSLEVLYALLQLYTSRAASSSSFSDVPYPHLQQRLQQTLRAVALTAFGAVSFPLFLLCLVPLLSPLRFSSFTAFLLVTVSLWIATVSHIALRYVLLPMPRRASGEPVRGGFQAAVCAVVDVVNRVRQQPQLPVLLLLCMIHSYAWKLVLYYGMEHGPGISVDFQSFAVAGGLVAFTSFVLIENSLAEDPFVLEPRTAFVKEMQRNVVRAVRRGMLVYIVGYALSYLFGGSSDGEINAAEMSFFSLYTSIVSFQVTTSILENLAILSATSVFRILLYRGSHQVVGAAFSKSANLWDSLVAVELNNCDVASALFATENVVDRQNATPLDEQYSQSLLQRKEAAMKKISDKKTIKAPADVEDIEIFDSLFKFDNLLTGCKFDAAVRESLFSSWNRWNALFTSSTAVVDGFTLMLQLLNALPETKGDPKNDSPTGALALEKSVATLLRFLNLHQDAHPLFLLQHYPHLANLRISSSSVKSSIRYFFESKLQFANRRFILEEARRRVFQRVKVVYTAETLLCHLVCASRAEDKQGYVQHAIPAVLSSLVDCRNSLTAYLETCLKGSVATDVYVQQATALAKGIDSGIYRITEVFQGELSLLQFSSDVRTALLAYTSFEI